MFKFNLEQVVFYLMDNRVHSAPITSRMIVENAHDDWCCTNAQKETWQPWGPTSVVYATTHGILKGVSIFASRDELAESLKSS